MLKATFCFCFLLIHGLFAVAQTPKLAKYDSLKNKDFEYFKTRYHATNLQDESIIYATAWLAKAKNDQNLIEMALAYQAMMHKSEKHVRLLYADSILNVAVLTKDNAQIGAAYLTKGSVYYELKKHNLALDNYIIADEYVSTTNDEYLTYKIKYTIAQTKMYLGFYEEAIALLSECLIYFENENERAYLNTIHSLGLCYNKTKRYERCTELNRKGIDLGILYDNLEMQAYFKHSEGVNQYFLQNYEATISLLNQSLPTITERKDGANQIIAFFYLGKAHLATNHPEKAFSYFIQVDSLVTKERFYRPDIRENYEILIKHYQSKKDLNKELYFVKRLLEVDSLLHKDFRYLSGKVVKEYDTKKLLYSQAKIERTLQSKNIKSIMIIILLLLIVCFILYRYFQTTKNYKKKFAELMSTVPKITENEVRIPSAQKLDIAPEVEQKILRKLESFERNKTYIEKDMTSNKLAERLETNAKYVSLIIPKYRGKKTITYISDLKIEYIIEELKTHKKYRNYKNKSLAEMAGFGSTQNFTKAFKARTGISPTFFIEELKKTIQSNELEQ